jgi:hypothetical protein
MDVTTQSFVDNNDVSEEPADSTSTQKTVISIHTAVKTSNSRFPALRFLLHL